MENIENYRPPPQSIEIEQTILASFLINHSLLPNYIDILPEKAFYKPAHLKIYATMKKMVKNGISVDIITLSEELKSTGHLDDIGGDVYLGEIAERIGTIRSIPQYFKTIIGKMIARDLIIELSTTQELLYNEKFEIKDILNKIETAHNRAEKNCDLADIPRVRTGRVSSFNDYWEQVTKYKKEGFQNIGVSPGTQWELLTEHYRPAKGMLNIFTGIPGHGKSEFVDALMINLSLQKGWTWAVYSPENWPLELHAQKLIEKITGKKFFDVDSDTFEKVYDFLDTHFKIIEPDEDNLRIDPILKLYRECIDKHNVDGCILDPWNEMDNTPDKNENLTAYIGRKLAAIRRFSRKNNIFFGIVAHPQKIFKNPKTKKYNVPRLYDISDSANWNNKADNGICIYRDFQTGFTQVHIQKIKFKIHGKVGCVSFSYDRNSGRYSEYDETAFSNEQTEQQTDLWQNRI